MELNPLGQINPITIVAVIVIFTSAHFVLRRTFFLPVIGVMEQRRERLEAATAKRDDSADVSRTAEAQAEAIRARAAERADHLTQTIRGRAQAAREERLEAARSDGAELMERGRREIAQEREAELTKLRAEAAACVSLACERLLGGVEAHTIDSVVDRLVARRVH